MSSFVAREKSKAERSAEVLDSAFLEQEYFGEVSTEYNTSLTARTSFRRWLAAIHRDYIRHCTWYIWYISPCEFWVVRRA